jgi:hypothetical protein
LRTRASCFRIRRASIGCFARTTSDKENPGRVGRPGLAT